jgi:hypothetical protein
MQPDHAVEEDAQGDGLGQRLASLARRPAEAGQRVARHVVHDQEDARRALADIEHRDDVGVPEPRGELGLLHQVGGHLALVGVVRQLDGDVALEATDATHAAEIDGGHAAAGDAQQHLVAPDAVGRQERLARPRRPHPGEATTPPAAWRRAR